ncbi:MAG: hypothetical protein ACKVQB_03730, partial [Bacteroidia bacterium]
WAFKLNPRFSAKHIFYFIGICILINLFVSYSLSLFRQVFHFKLGATSEEVLDEDEIIRHKNHD